MRVFNQFISAAVRRDRGKVICNKVNGNAHGSRINIVNKNQQYISLKEVYSYSDQGLV